ncbi:protein of unknown function [Methylocella tundrae]|uniref:Uncharacterized protein n=1 Tax=Methylocella tundrae TaxID=227605 RepID=A0A4U8Z6S9_METTU|nr:protein of unknown function [Methylocella tundrae]
MGAHGASLRASAGPARRKPPPPLLAARRDAEFDAPRMRNKPDAPPISGADGSAPNPGFFYASSGTSVENVLRTVAKLA